MNPLVQHLRNIILFVLLGAALGACVGSAREPLGNLSELGSDETIVVGRVELVPVLQKNEQKIKGLNSASFEKKLFLFADEKYRVFKQEPQLDDYAGRIEATIGNNFFVRSNSKTFHILGGMMYLEVGGKEMNRAYFPGGYKATIRPGDKAIYIGTIQYHRNEFFDISKVSIVDDYDRANIEFKNKYGGKYTLSKALLTPAK